MTWDEYSPIGPMTYIGDRSGKVPTAHQKGPWRCDQGHEGKWHRNYLDQRLRVFPITGRLICPECSKLTPRKKYEFAQLSIIGPKLLARDIEILFIEERLKQMDFYNFHCLAPGCGHEWGTLLNQILNGSGCPRCAGKERYTTQSFIEACIAVHGNDYDYGKTVFENWSTRIIIWCKKCKKDFKQLPGAHRGGCGCSRCAGLERYTTESFIEACRAVHGNDYDYSETVYAGTATKIIIWCKKCEKDFKQFPGNHLHAGCGCPRCAPPSKGEETLRSIFDNLGFRWDNNRDFDDLRSPKGGIPTYDLWIPELGFLVEYDGSQHFNPDNGWYDNLPEGTFEDRVKADRQKTAYARGKGIPFIRIPFWHIDEIELIINRIFDDTDFIPIYNARVERETNEKYPELKNIQG
jgi:protein-arginine kinase activator protein McsA